MAVSRGELRVLGYLFPCGSVGPKSGVFPRVVALCRRGRVRAGIENSSRDTPNVQNYTCTVLAGTAVNPWIPAFLKALHPGESSDIEKFQLTLTDTRYSSTTTPRADSSPDPRAYSHSRAYSSADSGTDSTPAPLPTPPQTSALTKTPLPVPRPAPPQLQTVLQPFDAFTCQSPGCP